MRPGVTLMFPRSLFYPSMHMSVFLLLCLSVRIEPMTGACRDTKSPNIIFRLNDVNKSNYDFVVVFLVFF